MPFLKRKKTKAPATRKTRKTRTEASKTVSHKKREVSKWSRAFQVLKRPCNTEKGTNLQALNQYVFEIDLKANRKEVKKAIEELYGVKVLKVNIINFAGKQRKYGRSKGRTKAWKKAMVTLRQGDTIKLFEGV